MVIVAGWLRLDEAHVERYLDECLPVIEAARSAPGCLDFHLSRDPLDTSRINVFERWGDSESVERFRGSGPSDDQQTMIISAQVEQYEVASTTSLT